MGRTYSLLRGCRLVNKNFSLISEPLCFMFRSYSLPCSHEGRPDMNYELPASVRSAQDLRFSDAVYIPKNPIGLPGRMLSMGPNLGSVLSFRVKKWGNGANNSRSGKPKDGAGHGNRSLKELGGKTAHK